MINPVVLTSKLAGLVGISANQPYNPKYQILDAANLSSRSGYFISDNPFCKVELIKDTQDYDDIATADFNNWCRTKLATAAKDVANWVFNENDFITRQPFYANALNKVSQTVSDPPVKNADGNYANVYALPPGFSGYWIQVSQDNNVAFVIKRIMLEFNGTGSFTLYLLNTADVTNPIYSQEVTVTGPFMEIQLNDKSGQANGWVCDNTAGAGYKGDYYIGYFAEDMGDLQPYQRQYREAALMSNVKDIVYYRANFAQFINIEAPFDLVGFTPFAWYNGLNPDVTVYKDFTDLIIQNERLFARAIQLKAQISFMSEYIASIRSNKNERLAAQMAQQIEGEDGENNIKVKGLSPLLYGAIGQIKKEISKLQTSYSGEGMLKVETLD